MLNRIYKRILRECLKFIPAAKLSSLIYDMLEAKSLSSNASDSLKALFELDNRLYGLQGREAVRLDKGIHPKHRILRYKEWFRDALNEGDVVLDVGSNTGLLPEMICSKATFVYGIEIVQEYVNKAKVQCQKDNVEFICANAASYDYTSCKAIDCVTLSNVLEHIEKRVAFLKKMTHQVKWNNPANKRFLIRVPVIERDWRAVLKKELGCEWRLDATHFTEYTKDEFFKEMEEAGIEVVHFDVRFGEIYAECIAS